MSTNNLTYGRAYYKCKRNEVIELLGGRCSGCGSTEFSHLEFHHKNGYDGPISPNGSRGGIRNLWHVISLIKQGRIGELDLLCKQCNLKENGK